MTDNLFFTLLKEIVDYRKTFKIENDSQSGRYLEYKKLVEILRTINYTDIDQHNYLSGAVNYPLDTLYENADYANI